MQIIIFTLLIIAVIIYGVYKIKKTFTKTEIISFFAIIIFIIFGMSYLNNENKNKLPDTFKKEYLKNKKVEISKISFVQTNISVLNSTKEIYDFVYIITKNNQEYVCEAKNVEAQLIEDEYVFKPYKEDCRLK